MALTNSWGRGPAFNNWFWRWPNGAGTKYMAEVEDIIGGNSSTTSAADSLAIPITASLVLKTTGADAEALTLANGSPGQVITINLDTDGGGDGTLTPATASGWATVVLADAGDTITVKYIDDTVGWIVLGCYGLTAQPTITAPA